MTTRIDTRFAALKAANRPGLVTYFMGGDPDYETALAIMKALPAAGSDVIELGMPFSDPMADGPAIQAAGLRALKGGQTLKKTLRMAADFRQGDNETPIVLMGYYNPIYIYGVEKFLVDAKASGIDGLISAGVGHAFAGTKSLPSGPGGKESVIGPGGSAPASRVRRTVSRPGLTVVETVKSSLCAPGGMTTSV